MFFIVLSFGCTRQIGRAFTEIGRREPAKWGTSIVSQQIYLRLWQSHAPQAHTRVHTQTQTHTSTFRHRHIKQKLAQCVQIFVVWLKETLESIMLSYISIYTDIWHIQMRVYIKEIYIYIYTVYVYICLSFRFTLLTNLTFHALLIVNFHYPWALFLSQACAICHIQYIVYSYYPTGQQTARN